MLKVIFSKKAQTEGTSGLLTVKNIILLLAILGVLLFLVIAMRGELLKMIS